jgi:hypothetical protein
MLNPLTEELISLKEATQIFPRRRQGKKPSIACMYRYSTRGWRGIVLETIQAGGTRATSKEAVARFLRRMTAAVSGESPESEAPSQASIQAEQELNEAGI